jgi:uncharacterized protein YbjT (DUF2867 family)
VVAELFVISIDMKIIITGSTGTAGSEVARQAVADDDIEQVILIARKPTHIRHPKIREIIHQNFLDYSGLENVFKEADACIWCLGISQTQVTKEEYFVITHDYAVAAGKAMLAANPSITFLFLSGQGADTTEKSRVRFARVKGQTENVLRAMNFKKLLIFRPGGINAVTRPDKMSAHKKFETVLVSVMKAIIPGTVVDTDVLAKAMLKTIKQDTGLVIIDHKTIRRL